MLRLRRAALGVAVAALAALPVACGGDGGDGTAEASACLPEAYAEFRRGESYPERVVEPALKGRFRLKKVRLELEPPIDWEQNPISSAAFQGKLQDLTWLDPLLYAYENGDRDALARSRDIALDWIEANPVTAAGRAPGGAKPWVDKIAAERAPYLASIAEAADCEGLLSDSQRAVLRKALVTHGEFLADPETHRPTNHGLYVDRGLEMLTRVAPSLLLAEDWALLAERRFLETLEDHLAGDEGFWLEHSAAYQVSTTRLVERVIASGLGGPRLEAVAGRMSEAAAWLLEPDDGLVLYGDSNLKEPTEAERERAAQAAGLEWMPRTGLAFVKRPEPGAYLAVFASFHSGIHKHADELSFDLFDAGTRIVSDSGIYHKDDDAYAEFQRSPRAHSVLRADRDSPLAADDAYGSGLEARGEDDGWYAVLAGNALLESRGVEHERLFLYRPGYALVVVDRVRSAEPHSYERLFQLGPEVMVERDSGALRLRGGTLDGLLTSRSGERERISLVRGSEDPLGGFVFPRFRVAEPRYAVSYRTRATDLDAVATFALDAGEPVVAELVSGARGAVELRLLADGEELGAVRVARRGGRLDVQVPEALRGEPIR